MPISPEASEEERNWETLMASFEHRFPGLAEQIKNLTAQRLSVLLMMGMNQQGSSGSSANSSEILE
jgi:hypothetical protein